MGIGRRGWADLRARRRLRIARYWQAAGDLDEAARHALLASRLSSNCEITLTLAEIERGRGEYASCEARLVELVDRLEDPALLARALTALAITRKEVGDHDQAHRLYTRIGDLLPADDAGLQADLHHNLAGLAYARERYDQAERYARQAVELRRAAGASELGLAPDRAVLAAALAARHHYDEARHELALALAACRASRPPRRYEIAVQLHNLAAVEHASGQPGRAEELYREALALKEELLGPDHAEIALLANNLGTLLHERQRGDEAAVLLRRALAIAERGYPANHPVTADIRRNLGTVG